MPSKKFKVTLLATACISALVIISCRKNSSDASASLDPALSSLNLPSTAFNYANPALPDYLQTPPVEGQINTPPNNPITDWGATLGRVLFYDKNLSINNAVACASCHKQATAFADPVKLSSGFNGGLTGRNSMGLTDARYYPNGRFFWDERAATLEIQTLTPVQNHVEMGMTLDSLEKKLKNLSYYPVLFTKAFGDNNITSNRVSLALSQFVRSIVSYQSKYDQGRQTFPGATPPPPNANFSNFTADENRGKALFFDPNIGCAACHGTETFTAATEKNNGLDASTTDRGFGAVTNNTAQDGLFKVSSLRNIELTGPYMHDGRFNTLDEVVEHYSSGVQNHPNLSPQLKLPNGNPKNLNLSAADKGALVAFLKTLTDRGMTTDEKYSSPFK